MKLNKIKYNRLNTSNKIDEAVSNLVDVLDNSKYVDSKIDLEDVIFQLNRLSERIYRNFLINK